MMKLPLQGMIVLDFSQYLSGPSASLRLADFGARVIKIERPITGDAGRKLAIKDLWVGENSLLFHTINRNKESFTADLKNENDIKLLYQIIAQADVVIHNFRPGIMDKVGLNYDEVKKYNPSIIYAAISGYGNQGPWKNKPGQDLLLQSLSGLVFTTGNETDPPVPFGSSIADILSGAQLVQGILAAAIKKQNDGVGSLIEVSLMESLLDFQFELLTTFYSNKIQPKRANKNNAHALLGAPYGIYKTQDGFIALAMIDLNDLASAIQCESLLQFSQDQNFSDRNKIKELIADHLLNNTTTYWLKQLQENDLWASNVFDWQQMVLQDAYKGLNFEQKIKTTSAEITTTRCPIKFDGVNLTSNKCAPSLGENNVEVLKEFIENKSNKLVSNNVPLNNQHSNLLLDGITIVDFSQFLSGPSAALRLSDLGANVIKIEKPGTGDICRHLYVSDIIIEGESTIFHAINRNKKSYSANLKCDEDIEKIKILLAQADVMMHNFRPGVMDRLGLSYDVIKDINPNIVYAEISGYGNEGPWKNLPGQDLLLQSVSGLTWLSHNNDQNPTPMGVAVADILAGTHLAQGILAAIYKRNNIGLGSLVQVSMFESILDFQFETLTCFYNDGNELPVRGKVNNAHSYIGAPYGIYKTQNGYISLAMANIATLANLLQCDPLKLFTSSNDWFVKRDEIKAILKEHLLHNSTEHWLSILEKADIWCSNVYNYNQLIELEAYKLLNMELTVETSTGLKLKTTRCPIKVNGKILSSHIGAPVLGEHNAEIDETFGLITELISTSKNK